MENIPLNTLEEQVVKSKEISAKTVAVEKGWKRNIVKDIQAPAYFSQPAIWGFSTFFSVIIGGVLLYANLRGNIKGQWTVMVFGVLYTVLEVLLLTNMPSNTALTISINALTINAMGSFILTQLFWDRYVGEDTRYRTRPVLMPLVISVLVTVPVIILIMYRLLSQGL